MTARDEQFDAIIVGLGAMGSAALYHLASRGVKVLGIDRLQTPHIHGSTHGRTRIIREAYYEHPCYVPIVQRAYELWATLERDAGEQLFVQTGGLMIGPPEGELFAGALRSATEHGLAHEVLEPAQVHARFPGFVVPAGSRALHEPRAGLLLPEKIVEAHLALAKRAGATIRTGVTVTGWDADGGVRVRTDAGELRADTLILAAGPWLPALVPDLDLPLEVERQLFHWFEPSSHQEWYDAEHSPISLIEYDDGRFFATFPDVGHGVKAGIHHEGAIIDIDDPRAPASDAEGAENDGAARALSPAGRWSHSRSGDVRLHQHARSRLSARSASRASECDHREPVLGARLQVRERDRRDRRRPGDDGGDDLRSLPVRDRAVVAEGVAAQ